MTAPGFTTSGSLRGRYNRHCTRIGSVEREDATRSTVETCNISCATLSNDEDECRGRGGGRSLEGRYDRLRTSVLVERRRRGATDVPRGLSAARSRPTARRTDEVTMKTVRGRTSYPTDNARALKAHNQVRWTTSGVSDPAELRVVKHQTTNMANYYCGAAAASFAS